MAINLLDDILKGYARGMFSYTHYITHTKYITNKDIIDTRIKIIQFSEKYGILAATEAFGVSRATIYNWKKRIRPKLGAGYGGKTIFSHLDELAPSSRKPKNFRKSKVDIWYKKQILSIRKEHSRLGKSKVKSLLDDICKKEHRRAISESTIGRIIKELKQSGELIGYSKVSFSARTGRILTYRNSKPRLIKQRRKGYVPKEAGDLVQIDCV